MSERVTVVGDGGSDDEEKEPERHRGYTCTCSSIIYTYNSSEGWFNNLKGIGK